MPTILYVEDNEDNVYMLVRRLRRHGFEVIVAADGAQGVEAGTARAAGPGADGPQPAGRRRLGSDPAAQGRTRDPLASR